MKKFVLAVTMFLFATGAWAAPPSAKIVYQPMTAEGLAAGYPFEAWVYFDKSPDPAVPGYAFPAGATLRFTFPAAFVPQTAQAPAAVLLHGWPQGPIVSPFTIGLDPKDQRTIVLKLTKALPSGPPEAPGLKAIHLRWGPVNPKEAAEYPMIIEYVDAGDLSGSTKVMVPITAKPVPNISGHNTLHAGRNENYQHVKAGQQAKVPINFLVTLPDKARSFISLRPMQDGNLEIMSDGSPIGTITKRGAPITLKPEPFGPGYARLGLVQFYVTAGGTPGEAEIEGRLTGGTSYTIKVTVEP
jgi:hypothetical protein